ncbi:MAG: hypothetical protein EBS91_00295 [Betaproteobacteria bacterium]|nr:hypothetical protein [Betaproteobacteria bacterium]
MLPMPVARALCLAITAVAGVVAPFTPSGVEPAEIRLVTTTAVAVEVATTAPPVVATAATTAVTERSPAEVERSRRCPEFEALFEAYGLEPIGTFSFIAWRETRCDPTKVNAEFGPDGKPTKTLNRDGSYDVGLLQINSTWKTVTHEVCGTPWGQMFALVDLDCNLKVARYLLDNGGLGHWAL